MDYEAFVKEIFDITKIDLNCYKEKQMHRRIDTLVARNGVSDYADYVKMLKTNPSKLSEFLGHITINVSEFYRNPEQWKIFESEILPAVLKHNKSPHIWSAACSSGDEPYTIAMILSKLIPTGSFKITATDIDKDILEKARAGAYAKKSLDGLPQEYVSKYFSSTCDTFVINSDIKRSVEFKNHNLLRDSYPTNVDLIVCRNVLIYFTDEAKDQIYTKFSQSLTSNGILFIGATEQIISPQKFNLKAMKTFFYEKDRK